jgi:hypothetical protein
MGLIDANRLGVVAAVMMAGWHAVWAVLMAGGLGQQVMDLVFRLHGLKSDVVVEPFDAGMMVLLVAAAGVLGYVVGALAGLVWNGLTAWGLRGKPGVASRA